MSDQTVKENSFSLQFVSDWFVTRGWMWMWHDDYYDDDSDHWDNDDDEDKFFEWYDGYQNRKAQKASIKEQLLRYWDWCMSEGEKKKQKNYGHKHRLSCIL